MDPLSLTASIVSLLGIGSEVSRYLEEVSYRTNRPHELHALQSEVTDLQLIVREIDQSLLHRLPDDLTIMPTNLNKALEALRTTLLKWKKFITNHVPTLIISGHGLAISGAFCQEEAQMLKKLKDDIRSQRINLGLCLNLLVLYVRPSI